MAVTVRQNANGTTGAATTFTTITPAFPGASVSGSTVILVVASDATVATPSGWVSDRAQVNNDGHYHFRRTSAGETTYTPVAITGASCWWLLELAGTAPSPLDGVISTGSTTAVATLSTGTTVSLVQTDEVGVASWASSTAAAGATWSGETNGYAELSADIVTTRASGANINLVVATKLAPLGTTETSTATIALTAPATAILTTYKATAVTVTPRAIQPIRRLQAINRAGSF